MASNESIGARLKRVRLEKGISLDDAHRATKIHLEVLRQIEEDHYDSNPVYLKGFLKIYCGYLGVDLPETVAVKKHTQVQTKPLGEPVREKKPAGVSPDIRHKLVPPIVAALMALAAVFCVVAVIRFLAAKAAVPGSAKKHAQIVRMKKEKIAAKKTETRLKAKAAVKDEPAPAAESLRLGVRALEDCWLQLKADHKVVFQNILKKGRFESWEADDRMDMVLGSAGGVQIEINGKIIPSLGKRGQVLKNILITRKDGLTVGK